MNRSDLPVMSHAVSWPNLRKAVLLSGSLLLLLTTPSNGRVASISIDELIAQSDAIVIATVSEVAADSNSANPIVYATALVQRSLKGSLNGNFRFYASGGWVCDTSSAVQDETALFFLGLSEDGTYYLRHAGRGRMPFRDVDGKTYVTLWDDVRLSKDAPMIAGPEPKYQFIKSVELGYLESLIRRQKS
jgi:hypothetical protein